MKTTVIVKCVAVLAAGSLLASCGGGADDESGALGEFATIPTEVTWKGTAGCPDEGVDVSRVVINGGTAPYTVTSLVPGRVRVNRQDQILVGKEGSFLVSVGPGCFEGETIVVRDALKRAIAVSITYEGESN